MSFILSWAQAHPLLATIVAVVLLAVAGAVVALVVGAARKVTARTPGAVVAAAIAAAGCTAYSADTSWRFAANHLDMGSGWERAAMFAAAEAALFSVALMARQNLRTTGAPGTPGVLVWVITGVQIIPAYAESGFVGGTVRAFVGPVLAAVLWHLAMGIELRHHRPGADSGSLPALLAREARERMLSRLGLAVRDRSAEQITRDRWTVKAVALAARLAEMKPEGRGRARTARRLSVAVGRAQAGADEGQRRKLLELLAARRHAAALATITLPSPWQPEPLEVTAEVAIVRAEETPLEVVVPSVAALPPGSFVWDDYATSGMTRKVTSSVPAAMPRQVATEVVTLTPSDLRRQARRLHRRVVISTGRPVTIDRLREEFGLSRREAVELRRDVVDGGRS
ncbi:MAG TPA: hypothetical protein DEQ61_23595 [Streptomyces sp.]|nr:hypothetical protein [Streptomyces sp.]